MVDSTFDDAIGEIATMVSRELGDGFVNWGHPNDGPYETANLFVATLEVMSDHPAAGEIIKAKITQEIASAIRSLVPAGKKFVVSTLLSASPGIHKNSFEPTVTFWTTYKLVDPMARRSFLTCPHQNVQAWTDTCLDCGYNVNMTEDEYASKLRKEAKIERSEIEKLEDQLGIKR